MEVVKNIYQVLGGSYANIANIFVIKAGDELVLVDTAETEAEYEMILENIRGWGLDRYPISCVLLSHKHLNHIGNAYRFREQGAQIVAGYRDAEAIEQGIITEICDFYPFPKKVPYVPCKVIARCGTVTGSAWETVNSRCSRFRDIRTAPCSTSWRWTERLFSLQEMF